MHREDNSRFVLYIEPSIRDKSLEPIDDELTDKVQSALDAAVEGAANYREGQAGTERFTPGSGWRGWQGTPDGECCSSHDYLLPNGLITNACAVHYVRWFRSAIPECDMVKLGTL